MSVSCSCVSAGWSSGLQPLVGKWSPSLQSTPAPSCCRRWALLLSQYNFRCQTESTRWSLKSISDIIQMSTWLNWSGVFLWTGKILSMREERGYFLSKKGAPLSIKYIYILFVFLHHRSVWETHTALLIYLFFVLFLAKLKSCDAVCKATVYPKA